MRGIITEVILIFLLLLVNGVLAMVEIAVVSAQKGRLRRLAGGGNVQAKLALELAEAPNRFLATVQIGITLVGILAGAFGGATIAEQIRGALQRIPVLAPYGEALGLALVVAGITYFSLVLGELVPKRLGLAHPEEIAMAAARPMHRLSILAGPLVRFLGGSTECLLGLFGFRRAKEPTISEEEVKTLMQEGVRAGAFNRVESQMVESVLGLDRLAVREFMTPRPKIIWVNRDDPHEKLWHKIVVSGHSFFPVYAGGRDHVVGVVAVKAIYANLAAGAGVKVSDLMVKPLIVPATQPAIQLLEALKQSGHHLALVSDEFGDIVGLVTLKDVMEVIVGEFPSPEERARPEAVKREDGSWLIDAMLELQKLESVLPGFHCEGGEGRDYRTLAGFIVKHLGHLPKEGELLETQGYVFEVLDMDGHRVDKVLVVAAGTPDTGGGEAATTGVSRSKEAAS